MKIILLCYQLGYIISHKYGLNLFGGVFYSDSIVYVITFIQP